MTSSGTYNFSPSNGEIVLAGFERIQVRAPSIRPEHMQSARREINFLLAGWSNKTPNLWKVQLQSTTLTQGITTASVPPQTVMILDAYISQNTAASSQVNRYVTPISRTEYASYSQPQTQGFPSVYWFDRLISPTVTFYQAPDSAGPYVFNYYACNQVQDANIASGETPDIPYRFLDAMVADIAHRMSRIYAPPLEAIRKQDAKDAWDVASSQDVENVKYALAPQLSVYYRR
jgi:hypothetical protein